MQTTYRPIHGISKSERIFFSSMPNQVSWSGFKMLREHNKNKRVYDIDPYVEVYPLTENMYGLYHPNCDGGSDVWMYLVVGPEKAMLIDTAYGLGDLKGLADLLSGGKELIVVNTHTGPDHVLGDFRFDKVYCHEYEADNIRYRCSRNAFDYLFDEKGDNIWCRFDRKDLPEYRDVNIVGVPDGYTWDLGDGCEIELIWTAGHMPGHAMYLDKKGRTLFGGDDVCSDIIGISGPKPHLFHNEYRNVQSYRDRLQELVKRVDEFDYIFPGHFMVNIESCVLFDILDTLNLILEDPEGYDFKDIYISGSSNVPIEKMFRRVKGFGSVGYERDSVYPMGQEPEGYRVK